MERTELAWGLSVLKDAVGQHSSADAETSTGSNMFLLRF